MGQSHKEWVVKKWATKQQRCKQDTCTERVTFNHKIPAQKLRHQRWQMIQQKDLAQEHAALW
jgi:hypothetical protein